MAGSVIPAGYEGSVCEIKTTENTFITTGRISSVSEDKIKLHIKSKAFRSVPFGFRVKINIVNSKLGFRVIEGKVYTETNLENLECIPKIHKNKLKENLCYNVKKQLEYQIPVSARIVDAKEKYNVSKNMIEYVCNQKIGENQI